MKKIFSFVISFILMTLLIFVSTIIFSKAAFTNKKIMNVIKKEKMYEMAYNNIINEVDNYVVNQEILNDYHNLITKNLVEEDINKIISNFYLKKEIKISRYQDFYKIINKYNSDKEINDLYASGIDEIYQKNIFPTQEYRIINKYYIGNIDSLFLIITAGLICIFSILALVLINKDLVFVKYSTIGYSVYSIFIYILFNVLFNGFIYSNIYFTNFLKAIFNNILIYQLIVAIIILFYNLGLNLLKKLKK